MKAIKHHTDNKWILLYIERWLKAPIQLEDGSISVRDKGAIQGSLCKALHKDPYAKKVVMRSRTKIYRVYKHLMQFYFA